MASGPDREWEWKLGKPVQSERGAVAIIVAAALVMLMGFAAIAVDTGAAFSERRQDQSASDMAALAALQFARGSSDPATAANNGANEAIAVATASLDSPPSAAEWSACTDPSRPGEFTRVSTVSPCISFTGNLQKSRVVTPTIAVGTAFGRVLGVSSIDSSALAEAQADLGQAGRVMPFGLPSGSAGDTEVCLRDSNNAPPPCDGPDQGNFGTVDFSMYGNATLGTIQACNPNPQKGLETNMVVGADHPLGTIDGQTREDGVYCPIFNSRPNHIWGRTGIGSALYPGIVGGTSEYLTSSRPGRLARGSNRVNVENGSPSLDDTPLWSFLNGSGPASCSGVTNTSQMASCISDYRSGGFSTPIFQLSIGDAVRFGAVPQLEANAWDNGHKRYGIVDIVPVYLQATYWKCTGSGTCTIIHFPGDAAASSGLGSTVNGQNRLNAITAFLLDIDMLPEPLKSNFPSSAEQVDYALVK